MQVRSGVSAVKSSLKIVTDHVLLSCFMLSCKIEAFLQVSRKAQHQFSKHAQHGQIILMVHATGASYVETHTNKLCRDICEQLARSPQDVMHHVCTHMLQPHMQ